MSYMKFCALILLAIFGGKLTTATNAHARFDTKLKKDLETCRLTVCSSFNLDEGLHSSAFQLSFVSWVEQKVISSLTCHLIKPQWCDNLPSKFYRHELRLQMCRTTVLRRSLQWRTYRRWRNRLPPLQTVYFVRSQRFTDNSACGEKEALIMRNSQG